MTAIRHSILTVASVLALGLWVGYAAADEPAPGAPAAEEINIDTLNIDNGALGNDELVTVSTGQSTAMMAVSAADADVEDNDITNSEGSTFQTGSATGIMANSGGLNTNMVNTGANVVMQANTTINLYLGGSSATP